MMAMRCFLPHAKTHLRKAICATTGAVLCGVGGAVILRTADDVAPKAAGAIANNIPKPVGVAAATAIVGTYIGIKYVHDTTETLVGKSGTHYIGVGATKLVGLVCLAASPVGAILGRACYRDYLKAIRATGQCCVIVRTSAKYSVYGAVSVACVVFYGWSAWHLLIGE